MFARKAFSLAAHVSVASYHVTFVREVSSLAVHLSVTSYHVTCLMISVLTGKLRSLLVHYENHAAILVIAQSDL